MKVKLIHGTDYNDCAMLYLEIENATGKTIGGCYIGCLTECPKDAVLERDLNFVYDIPDYMRMAYEAGKKGEELIIEEEEEE